MSFQKWDAAQQIGVPFTGVHVAAGATLILPDHSQNFRSLRVSHGFFNEGTIRLTEPTGDDRRNIYPPRHLGRPRGLGPPQRSRTG